MVKRRWMEGKGNSRGRRITCKHVSSLNIRSIGRGISNDVGRACRSAVVPKSVLIFSLLQILIKKVSGDLVLYRAAKCGTHLF